MLRCSNAHALRTGVENSMALRMSLGTRLPRTIGRGATHMSQFSSLARNTRTTVPSRITPAWNAWNPTGGKRWYSDAPRPTSLSQFDIELDSGASEQYNDPDAKLEVGSERTDGEAPKPRDRAPAFGRKVSPKVIEMELKWLKDPRALADRVARLLNGHDVALATGLVRAAQKERMDCAVGWNHLFDYYMKKGDPKTAFKLYNDMKKRGRKPNERTYTIMLNGLSRAGRSTGLNTVQTAYSVYRSISAANSAVACSIIHSNAMLNVCWRLGDMDMLWRVAGELPEEGPGSPDPTTYTIIFSAIRDAMDRDVNKLQQSEYAQVLKRQAQGVKEAKRVWADIIYQWEKGRLSLDSHVAGAMSTILLQSASDLDCYHVLALFHQTHGIPILVDEPPKDVPRPLQAWDRYVPPKPQEDMEDVPFVDEGNRLYDPSQPEQEVVKEEQQEEEEEENFDNLFDSVVSTDATENASGPSYLTVGNRELSLILEACIAMTQSVGVKTGKAYWDYLTKQDSAHKVEPDPHSFHQYLRLLRFARSSRASVDLIRDQMLPSGVIDKKTFQIAMSCCRRDRNNPNMLLHANELLKLMDENLMLPNTKAMEGYLDAIRVLLENPLLLMSLNGLMPPKKRSSKLDALGRELQFRLQHNAIAKLRPLVLKLVEAVENGVVSRGPGSGRQHSRYEHKKTTAISGTETLKVLGQVRALIDNVLKPQNASFLPKRTRDALEMESKELRKYSKSEVMKEYKDKLISPTPEQVLAFEDRLNN